MESYSLAGPFRPERNRITTAVFAVVFVVASVGALWASSTIQNKWMAFSGLVVPFGLLALWLYTRRVRPYVIAMQGRRLSVGDWSMDDVQRVRLEDDQLIIEGAAGIWMWLVADDDVDRLQERVRLLQSSLAGPPG